MNLETFTPTESTNQPLTRADIEKLLQEVESTDKLDLSWQNMRGIDLSELDLVGASMSHANLLEATLEYANLSGAILKEAYLYETEKSSLVNRGIIDLEMVGIVM